MNIHEVRVKNLLEAIKMAGNQARLSDLVGVKSSYLSQIKNPKHKTNMGNDVASRIESALNLPNGWMDENHETRANQSEISNIELIQSIYKIPVLNWVQAGEFTTVADVEEAISWEEVTSAEKDCFAVIVRGDSMGEKYDGTKLIVRPAHEARSGQLVIAVMNNHGSEATFKRYIEDSGLKMLVPLNPQYPTIQITPEMDCRIVGVVKRAIIEIEI